MRNIKFRAWSPSKKIMGQMMNLELKSDSAGLIQFKDHQSFTNNIVIMQFTGLLDKNGVEIYEGDIIKDGDFKVAIEWNNSVAGFYTMPGTQRAWVNCEVIGNIYEHPKLLK